MFLTLLNLNGSRFSRLPNWRGNVASEGSN